MKVPTACRVKSQGSIFFHNWPLSFPSVFQHFPQSIQAKGNLCLLVEHFSLQQIWWHDFSYEWLLCDLQKQTESEEKFTFVGNSFWSSLQAKKLSHGCVIVSMKGLVITVMLHWWWSETQKFDEGQITTVKRLWSRLFTH